MASAMAKLARSSSCPSKITLTFATMKRCGNCGVVGHNRRTCQVPEHYADICHPTPPPPTDRPKKCGNCGEFGHNRRTCAIPKVEKPVVAKTLTSPQIFAQMARYVVPLKEHNASALDGLRGCHLFDEPKPTKNRKKLTSAERRAAASLAQLL